MTSRCSECGTLIISSEDEFELQLTTTPRALARYQYLLDTNEPLQDFDLFLIRPVADKTRARLACLEAEISRLKNQLRQLEAEHTVLSKYHSQNTTVLSPLRRMPSEVLTEIFLWTLPRVSVSGASLLDITKSPWVLTHVSSRWRAVTISNSSLWSRILLNFSFKGYYSLAMVRTQIERARTLKIRFYGSQYRDSSRQIEMLELLSKHSSMWEEIRIGVTRDLLPHIQALRDPLPALRRAYVQWDNAESQTGVQSIDCFRMAVSPLDIGANSEYRFVATAIPMHRHLTRYDFDAPWSTHSELLKSLPGLREVRIRCAFDEDEPWPESEPRIGLFHLWRLYVSHPGALDYLLAPNLVDIALGGEADDCLESFLIQSGCSIRRLCIAGLPDVQATADILQKYRSITELAVTLNGTADAERELFTTFLGHLTISLSAPIQTLLHIAEISFACRNADAVYYPLYLDMVTSRWNADGSALKAVELLLPKPHPDPDPRSLAQIDSLRQAGLKISLLSNKIAEARLARWFHITSWS